MFENINLYEIKPNQYKISEYGVVLNYTAGRILKPYYDKDGYIVYKLPNREGKIKTYKAHRLVALTYVYNPNPEQCNIVNHINGDKSFNHWTNLEWTTIAGNNKHANETGLHNIYGERNGNSIFTEKDIRKICEYMQSGYNNTDIIKEFVDMPGSSILAKHSSLSSIRHRKLWTHISKDYTW